MTTVERASPPLRSVSAGVAGQGAVEVLSPSDSRAAVQAKVAEYFAAGTRLVWLVEPAAEAVRVYRSPHDLRVLRGDDELTGDDVLPGFRCVVKRLFLFLNQESAP